MSRKVLVVDDSAAIRKSISFVLEQGGYEVSEAEDGMAALGVLDKLQVSLIITDVNMPNLDGIGLIRKVRESEAHRFVPIIVLTTEAQSMKIEEGRSAGATGWIVKPFSADKLLSVVKKITG